MKIIGITSSEQYPLVSTGREEIGTSKIRDFATVVSIAGNLCKEEVIEFIEINFFCRSILCKTYGHGKIKLIHNGKSSILSNFWHEV